MRDVVAQFETVGDFSEAVPYGSGHIHDTYLVRFDEVGRAARYIVQRINREVFRDPVALMDNLARVCAHQRRALELEFAPDRDRRCPTVILARDGRSYWVDPAGAYWRCFAYQEGTRSVDRIESEQQAYQIAHAFGSFAARLRDLPPSELAVTIPDFHDLEQRYAALRAAVQADERGEVASTASEIARSDRWFDRLRGELRESQAADLPLRVVHNDCKINNVLIDVKTAEGLCVIDLDTVMGGSVMNDFGELVRSASGRAREEEVPLEAISIELGELRGIARGYLAGAGSLVGAAELRVLPLAGTRMAFENAIRFLTDHLLGDVYFRTARRGQNLERCRAQLRLVELLSERQDVLRELLHDARAELAREKS
jgi:hypothetical protein